MPSHPIATWITPCNSRNVQVLGTSTRRHTIGLIPSSQTLTCTISAASALAADEAVSMTGLVRFGARVTRPAYRRSPFPVAGTPDILMLSVGGSWLNMAESIERVLKRRALDGQHPHSPDEIGSWFEQTARAWNEQPTPFVWNGKRRQRRRRSGGDQTHRLGGSGA